MKDLIKLFSILQLTKEQPLTGYLVAGVKLHEAPTLAEHHYTCVLMAYFLAHRIKQAGGKINERKLILLLLFHDLSELFGGDVSGPLNRKYPDLKEHKDKIGDRAFDMLGNYTDKLTAQEMKQMFDEFENSDSDEKWIAKILDQMDHQFFLEHNNIGKRYENSSNVYRIDFVRDHIYSIPKKLKDPKAKKIMQEFLQEFDKNFFNRGWQPISFLME